MPVYEYQCKKCGREAEYQQRMSDPEKTVCETCGAEALERIISRTAFTLKGGGWYKDLYSSTKPEKAGGEATSSESKPAADAPSTAPAAAAPSTASAPSTPSPSGSSSGGSSSGSGSTGSSAASGGSTKTPS